MSFKIEVSVGAAERRLSRAPGRRRRSDAGRLRVPAPLVAVLRAAAAAHDRLPMRELQRQLLEACARHGIRPPSRATVYAAFDRLEGHSYRVSQLPADVARCLHNLDADTVVPGRQVVFACLNHGTLSALSYAAGMPWIDLYQARRLRGWHPRSRGLLAAILRRRLKS